MPRTSPTARSSPTRTRSRMRGSIRSPNVWTGTWRDARFSPPADGGRPENALTGTIFMGNCCGALPLTVSSAEGQLRFWRNTPLASLAAGTSATIAPGIVGYEFDADLDNGFRPSGLMRLSTSTLQLCQRHCWTRGRVYGPGQITHALTLYRHGERRPCLRFRYEPLVLGARQQPRRGQRDARYLAEC